VLSRGLLSFSWNFDMTDAVLLMSKLRLSDFRPVAVYLHCEIAAAIRTGRRSNSGNFGDARKP
jgi:hypothetical protein